MKPRIENPGQNESVEQLQKELAFRGGYYFKDFGALLTGLLGDLANSISYGITTERKKNVGEMLNKIVGLYQSIPFEQITDHPDYDLFVQIREAIQKLIPEVEAVLSGEEKSVEKCDKLIKFIADKGREYNVRLRVILDKIRKQPGHENDLFSVVSPVDGKTWKIVF